jgi:hypothetical protein
LTNFIVLVLNRHLDFSFEKVNHIVWITHLGHIFLLVFEYFTAKEPLVEAVVEDHPFVGRFGVKISNVLAGNFYPIFRIKCLQKFVLTQSELST